MNKKSRIIICVLGMILGLGIITGTIIISKYILGSNNIVEHTQKPGENTLSENNKKNSNRVDSVDIFIAEDDIPKLSIWYVIAIIFGSLLLSVFLTYLIMLLLSKEQTFLSGNKIIIFILLNLVSTAIISFFSIYLTNNYILTSSEIVRNKLELNENFLNTKPYP